MSAPTSPAQQRTRRSRKSVAYIPSSGNSFDREIDVVSSRDLRLQAGKGGKKSRSKSLDPGGLEALKETNNNKQKVMPAVKSILKPIIALSPPRQIPARTSRPSSPLKATDDRSPSRQVRSSKSEGPESASMQATDTNPSIDTKNSQTVEDISQQKQDQGAATARAREREEAIKRRDERRKSLANRRVSFAPEATLHTWNVVELNEDATTSSEATNSTRRQSAGRTLTENFTHGTQHALSSDPSSTRPAQEERQATTPEHHRDVHQKKRRRSSAIPPMNFNNPGDFSSSPTSSTVDEDTQQSFITNGDQELEDDITETDMYRDDDTTAMEIDEESDENTGQSIGSGLENTSSSSSSAQLDARLRAATEQANTQDLDGLDIGASQPLVDEDPAMPDTLGNKQENESLLDADFAADRKSGNSPERKDDEEHNDDAMDMTQAVGGILNDAVASSPEPPSIHRSPTRRSSRVARRRSSGASSMTDDQTMDFTTAVGGIQKSAMAYQRDSVTNNATDDEDMSMEFTSVVGGVVDQALSAKQLEAGQAEESEQMEMTTAFGGVLSPVTERTEPSTEGSQTMDFTRAIGAIRTQFQNEPEGADDTMMDVTRAIDRILPNELKSKNRTTAKITMEHEAEHGQVTSSPLTKQPAYPTLPTAHVNADRKCHADTSPSPKRASMSPSRSPGINLRTPTTAGRHRLFVTDAQTPVQQITPQPAPRPTTPSKTPPSKNVAMRGTSPRKLFSQSTRERTAESGSPAPRLPTAQNRRATIDASNLSLIFTPQTGRLSGQGADQLGFGSPKIAELLDRRSSIGDVAETFTPQGSASHGVRFADPRALEQEVDREREEDAHRESGRVLLETEADPKHEDKDVTSNLRDMIDSLTPKKKKTLKARKSLAVGSARGLLGKRPLELDEDDDESPKRIQGPDHSPIKSVRLPAPPSKQETTGRLGKPPRFSLGAISGNVSTPVTEVVPPTKAITPKHQHRFRDAAISDKDTVPPLSFTKRVAGVPPNPVTEPEDAVPIHLQDFLNLINVRFMDLDTTKRRHTIAPQSQSISTGVSDKRGLEECVVAGVSTVPMLELYQHSCRELKKYISEGRNIVREIEHDTFEDNPALFNEYISAGPDIRAIMDYQFKNVKAHSRLLSRAMWYEWRMKLLDGLKDGLIKIGEGLANDSDVLSEQENLLNGIVPSLANELEKLVAREAFLRRQVDELTSSNQEELTDARQQLSTTEFDLEGKSKLLQELRMEKQAQYQGLKRLNDRKRQCMADIDAAQELCSEYKGWKASEVAALRTGLGALQKSSGWTIDTATDGCVGLIYRHAVLLYLKPVSFQPASADPSKISLSLVKGSEPTTQERFFLQLLRGRLLALDQASTPIREVLQLVSSGWDMATRLQSTISDLALSYITDVAITGDESVAIKASILLRQMRTRVLAKCELRVGGRGTDFQVSIRTMANVVYGEELKEGRMGDFLAQKVGGDADNAFGRWGEAVRELEMRLIARGPKKEAS